ncbi:uncharacterized protein LOC110852566 [Folsomia candida]|uniref:uncharacterized protein LOC110852566 n=1 Tax=Folsomia candida TaxID=158441 RepID=UPI000B908D42|nr:uncharacterized protein LOC110852566 [Folsomia candida]
MNQRSGASYLFPILLIIIAAFECYGQSMTDATCAKKNPPVPTGSKWVKNPNCSKGGAYRTGSGTSSDPEYRCHCWGHCGYICDPTASQQPDATSCGKKKPKVPSGSKWVDDPSCTAGKAYDTDDEAYHCHCWGYCGYICDPK